MWNYSPLASLKFYKVIFSDNSLGLEKGSSGDFAVEENSLVKSLMRDLRKKKLVIKREKQES